VSPGILKSFSISKKLCALLFFMTFFLFLSCISLPPQRPPVYRRPAVPETRIESIIIKTELIGPFAKNIIEITIHNLGNRDSLQVRYDFRVNKSSFVKNLWLEIDGKLQKAETLAREVGQRIFSQVVRRRYDPALLTTDGAGYYSLNVFPLNAGESRKVIIEFYSMLGEKPDFLFWEFKSQPAKILNMTLYAKAPQRTRYLKMLNGKPEQATPEILPDTLQFQITDSKSIQLRFYYPDRTGRFLIYNHKNRFAWLLENPLYKLRVNLNPNWPEYRILEEVVKYTKQGVALNGQKASHKFSQLGVDFISYLQKNHGLNILLKKIPGGQWRNYNSFWVYEGDSIYISNDPQYQKGIQNKFYCAFLDYFLEYNDVIDRDIREQIRSEYLTLRTAKVVLESNKRIQRIRREVIRKWEESLLAGDKDDQSKGGLPSKSKPEIIPFSVYIRPPKIIKEVEAVYPKFAKNLGIEGRVILKVRIDTTGSVEEVQLIRPHPLFNEVAIEAARQYKFSPGRKFNKKVPIWMTLAFNFKLEKPRANPNLDDLEKPANTLNWVEYFGKFFILALWNDNQILVEKGGRVKDARIITYRSPEHFEFLYSHPELIKYCLLYPRILISADTEKKKWYLIE